MSKNNLQFSLRDPLNSLDTETQTYGCRANNPDICSKCYLPGVCAFSSDDNICRHPSAKWKKVYNELKDEIK